MDRSGSPADEVVDTFNEAGYFVLKGFFSEDLIEGARLAMEPLVNQCARELAARNPAHDSCAGAPFETRLARLFAPCMDLAPSIFRRELHLSELFPIFFNRQLLDVVERIIGPEIRLYPNYSVRPKLPDHAKTLVLWHQDGGYTQNAHLDGEHGERAVEALRMVNVWCPLVPARAENGCMQFIPGTHKLGLVPHEGREFYLEISEETLVPLLEKAVTMELDPGDVVLFHNMLFHQGLPNRTETVRWSMDWRYQDATQGTMRKESGQLARSAACPEEVVKDSNDWVGRVFG